MQSLRVVTKDGTVLDVDHFGVGAGRAVILCHGIIQNRKAFEVPSFSVPKLLNDAGFDVYCVDMRGRDGSSARHDFAAYVDCQAAVSRLWSDPEEWSRRAILNVARMGYFSSDRSIREYADEIWRVRPPG